MRQNSKEIINLGVFGIEIFQLNFQNHILLFILYENTFLLPVRRRFRSNRNRTSCILCSRGGHNHVLYQVGEMIIIIENFRPCLTESALTKRKRNRKIQMKVSLARLPYIHRFSLDEFSNIW